MFKTERLMMALIERLKYDIEKCYPSDEKAVKLINDLLYHFAWIVYEKEGKLKEGNHELQQQRD